LPHVDKARAEVHIFRSSGARLSAGSSGGEEPTYQSKTGGGVLMNSDFEGVARAKFGSPFAIHFERASQR
jgi:hypothetical protein